MISLDDLEYTILGTLLREPEQIGETLTKISLTDFQDTGTRGLFAAIGSLHFAGEPVDPLTVLAKAGSDYEAVIGHILDNQFYTLQLDYYCKLLVERSRLTFLQKLGTQLNLAQDLSAAGRISDKINGAFVSHQDVEVVSIQDALVSFCSDQSSKEKPKYFDWGMERLNETLTVELGDFVVIGGYPSSGKTLLSLQFALRLAEEYRVGYFSLETSPKKLTDRILAHMSGVPLYKIKRHELTEQDWNTVVAGKQKFEQLHFDMVKAGGMSVRDIGQTALSKRYQIIVVDYLQLVPEPGKNRYEEVTKVSIGLHTFAQENKIAVIGLAQLTRPDTSKGSPKEPTMSSFRESGQIEQDADVAMLLYPVNRNDNQSNRILRGSKNKEGELFRQELEFDGPAQTMKPVVYEPGQEVMRKMSAVGRAAKARNARDPSQVKIVELHGADRDLPF